MIGPLLRVAASALSARTLRRGVQDAALGAAMTVGAALAVVVAIFCFSNAAFILLERQFDSAGAWAVLGAVWGAAGVCYFAATRRRR